MKRKWLEHTRRHLCLLGCIGLIGMLTYTPVLSADADLLRVIKGKSIVLQYHEKIKTVSLADQVIADVVSITATELVIVGKEVGMTSLFVWGESGQYSEYDVEVDRNVTDRQIVLEVKVAEINRTAASEYGVDFLVIDKEDGLAPIGEQTVGSYSGAVITPDDEELMAQEGVTAVLKWLGDKQEVSTVIRALQRNGDLKLLANPRLISFSGEEASFHVGGEIPVPIAQSISAGSEPTITVEWKEYGVRLNFVPTIIDTNLINLRITPEVSSIDKANGVEFGGISIPALRTRKADATVEMNSEQALVLGGLISTESSTTVSRLPILGQIPILSFFFSHRETSTQETELLIIVSPRIIESVAAETIPPLPGEEPEMESETSVLPSDTGSVDQTGTQR